MIVTLIDRIFFDCCRYLARHSLGIVLGSL